LRKGGRLITIKRAKWGKRSGGGGRERGGVRELALAESHGRSTNESDIRRKKHSAREEGMNLDVGKNRIMN